MIILITQNDNNENENFVVGDIHVSPQHNMMSKDEKTCRVQPKAMAVLLYLAKHNERVINNDELLDQVWQGRVVTHSSIQKSVNVLRSAFKELDSAFDYVLYFSKRGYQLVSPNQPSPQNIPQNITKQITFSLLAMFTVTALIAYLAYLYLSFKTQKKLNSQDESSAPFIQVKPFVSNTGREKIIAPHFNSNRVAFIRDELSPDNSGNQSTTQMTKSHLYIKGMNGQQWQVSAARGNFVNLAWSASGRNLVAIDAHYDSSIPLTKAQQGPPKFYTFHIYTLDYKAEKVIEKNLLSHWSGNIHSVAWWDEGTLEFTASPSDDFAYVRYRYDIAEQNISSLKSLSDEGKLVSSHIVNKQTALLRLFGENQRVYFLDSSQQLISDWAIPFKVISMNWISNTLGVLLLSTDNLLFILYADGRLLPVNYSPKVKGKVTHARANNEGQSIVLTVAPPAVQNKEQTATMPNKAEVTIKDTLLEKPFLAKGGGFIYSTTNIN